MNVETVSRPCANEDPPDTTPEKVCSEVDHPNNVSDAIAENTARAGSVLNDVTEKQEFLLDEDGDEQLESSNGCNDTTDTNHVETVATFMGDDWASGASSKGNLPVVHKDGNKKMDPSSRDHVLNTPACDAVDILETASFEKSSSYNDPEGVEKSVLEGGQSPVSTTAELSNNHKVPNSSPYQLEQSQRTVTKSKEVNVKEVYAYDTESLSEHSDFDSDKEGSKQELFSCNDKGGRESAAMDKHEEKCPHVGTADTGDDGPPGRDEAVLKIDTGLDLLRTNSKEEKPGDTIDAIEVETEKNSDVDRKNSGDCVGMEGDAEDLMKTSNKEKDTREESVDANDENMEEDAESDVDTKDTGDCVEDADAGQIVEAADASDVVEPSGGDNVGEWRIEICDVRTVSFEDEDMDTDEGVIIDLEQSDELSQSTGSQDEFLSPRSGFSKSDSSQESKNVASRTVSEPEYKNVASRTVSEPVVQVEKVDDDKKYENVDDDNKYGGPHSEENETSSNVLPKHSPKGNQSSTVENILEEENAGTDVLQHMYMQTSTLHDPELSTINTSGNSLASVNNEDSLKSASASDLLSELAENVKNIKAEPQDPQYDKALKFNPKDVDKKAVPELQNMSLHEMLRLPVDMQALSSSEGMTNDDSPEQPRSVKLSIGPGGGNVKKKSNVTVQKPDTAGLKCRSKGGPAVKPPVVHGRQQTIVHPDGSKTVAYLVPVQDNDKNCMFVSVPVSAAACSKPRPLVNVKQKTKSKPDRMLDEQFDFKQYLLDGIMKYSIKSVDVPDIWNFLQRKNAEKIYKAEKAPDQLNFSSTQNTCLECGDSFALTSSLECHASRCSMQITFRCNTCKGTFSFSNKCQLLSHIRRDSNLANPKGTPTIKINSELIDIVTPSLDKIHDNLLVKGVLNQVCIDLPTQRVNCLMCKQSFTNEVSLKIHFGSSDLICSFAYQCFQCDMVMPRLCALAAHKALHTSTTNYICPECGKPFTDASFFTRHILDECFHTSRVYLIECPLCCLQLEGLVVARKHIMERHSKAFYKCPICSMAYEQMETLREHVKEKHAGKQVPYEAVFINSCPFDSCKSLFHYGTVLEKHVDMHISNLKKNAKYGYKCLDCGEGSAVHSRKATLIAHKLGVHKKFFNVTCNCCGLLFKTCEGADRHRQRMHVDQPHFAIPPSVNSATCTCINCNKKFISAVALKDHSCGKKIMAPIQPKTKDHLLLVLCDKCKVYMPKDGMNGQVCADAVKCLQASMLKSKPFPVQLISPSTSVADERRYFCTSCNLTIPAYVKLEDHMAACHPQAEAKSSVEPKKYNYVSKDKRAAPQSKQTFYCNFCRVRFPNEKRLKIHVKEHGNSGSLVCPLCNLMAFESVDDLNNHCSKCNPHHTADVSPSTEDKTCVVCSSKFGKYVLMDHLKSHVSKGILVCCHCQKCDIESREELHAHLIDCARVDYPLEHGHCYTCKKNFPTLEILVMHLQDHVRDGIFVCCKCQSVFLTEKQLKLHHEDCGKEKVKSSSRYCSLCRTRFPNQKDGYLYRHITQHVIKGALICCVCQKMGWRSFSEVKSHQIMCNMIAEPEYKYKCKVCGSGFAVSDELLAHLKWHSKHQFFVCFKCQKRKFKSRKSWKRHESRCRNNLDGSREEVVTLSFSSRLSSTEEGTGYVTMDHFCEHCGKRCHSSSLLQEHVAEEHQTFPCHLCGLTYKSKEELVQHVNFNHDCKRTYISCNLCKAKKLDKRFASQVGLDLHLSRMHKRKQRSGSTDMKDFDKSVTSSPTSSVVAGSESSDTPPMKRLRVTGDSTYTCAKCAFVTENGTEFSEHIKDHNTSKDNQCPDCGLCFAIIPALKKHLFMVHKVRNSEEYLQEKGLKTEDDELDSDAEDVHPELKRSRWTNNFDTMASGMSKPKKIKQESSEDEEVNVTSNPLECRVCYKTFDNDKQLKTHMRTHGMAFIKATKRSAKKGASLATVSSPCKSQASAVTCKSEVEPEEKPEATADSCKPGAYPEGKTKVNSERESSDGDVTEKLKWIGANLRKQVVIKQEILDDDL